MPRERRKHKRVRRTCMIRVRPFQEDATTDNTSVWELAMMQNLSAAGMLFTSTNKISIGSLLEFNITSPFIPEPIHCIGEVCRVEEKEASNLSSAQIPTYSIAISFKVLSKDKEEAIKKMCGES